MIEKQLTVCITGDIDYFRAETVDCLKRFFDVLNQYGVKSELFITAKAALEYPERMKYVIDSGHMIAGHGEVHEAFYDSLVIQTQRLLEMKSSFLNTFGLTINGFRAPWYKHNKSTYQAVADAGLKYDCSKKRFEVAFKRVPFFQKKYMYTKTYPFAKPFLKKAASAYNYYCKSPRYPYEVVPKVIEFPTLGISDYSLIDAPTGPRFKPEESHKIAEVWLESLCVLKNRGGGVMTIQAHPGRMSPDYNQAFSVFIEKALSAGARFSTPKELWQENTFNKPR